jgi:hypothetical protein
MGQVIDLRSPQQRMGISESQQNIEAIGQILQTAGQYEQQRQTRFKLDQIGKLSSQGATLPQIIGILNSQPKFNTGVSGILQKVASMYQPRGNQDALNQGILGAIINRAAGERQPSKIELEQAQADLELTQSRTAANKAAATMRQQQAQAEAEAAKPIKKKRSDFMDEAIQNAKKTKVGKNYTQANLLDAWQEYKKVKDYDSKSDAEKRQLWSLWNSKIESKNKKTNRLQQMVGMDGEYEWNPNTASELEPYWQDLPDDEKQEIEDALKTDPNNLSEILRILKNG